MAKRVVLWLALLAAMVVAIVLGVPASRYAALGMINQEPFYENRPLSFWQHALKDRNANLRKRAAFNLGCIGNDRPAVAPDLGRALSDEDAVVRLNASLALYKMGPAARAALPELCAALKDGDLPVRMNAAMALSRFGPDGADAVPALLEALDDPANRTEITYFHRTIRAEIVFALGKVGPAARDAVPALEAVAKEKDARMRDMAAEALGLIDPARAGGDAGAKP
jgi:HEAT repeat protein